MKFLNKRFDIFVEIDGYKWSRTIKNKETKEKKYSLIELKTIINVDFYKSKIIDAMLVNLRIYAHQ